MPARMDGAIGCSTMELRHCSKDCFTNCTSSAQTPLSKKAVHLQELKSRLESWRGDGWLEQCCTSLAEQLRVAKAENTELQQELEALR